MNQKNILLIILLIWPFHCFLQLSIVRHQLDQQLRNQELQCITTQIDQSITKSQKMAKDNEDDNQIDDEDIDDNQNYKEICYEKDISYSLDIALNHEAMSVSIDTTIPISWIKGNNCHIQGSSKKCFYIKQTLQHKIKKKLLKNRKYTEKYDKKSYAMIEGSSELVKGIQQKIEEFQFMIRDSSKLTNVLELLKLGYFMQQESQPYVLSTSQFIKATQISQNLNYLMDGAISLRLDEMSEQSFLKELFALQQINELYLTIYLNKVSKTGFLSIGQIATKYSQYGYGGLQWIPAQSDEYYGKLPVISDILIDDENQKYIELKDRQYPAFLTLSASYIGLSKSIINDWVKKQSKKFGCKINEITKYMQCHKTKIHQSLTFVFDNKKMFLTFEQLTLKRTKDTVILNIKQTIHENYTILGEPIFEKYLIVIDYQNNKIGFSQKSNDPEYQAYNLIILIRFVCWIFFIGCSIIICYVPIEKCLLFLKTKKNYALLAQQARAQARRLKPRAYQPTIQNPYEELSDQIKDALQDD